MTGRPVAERRPYPRRLALLVVLALAALPATAACGAPAGPGAAARPAAVAPPGPASGTAAVPASLAFRGTTLDGAPFDASSMAGRPALLWFWAPWCATCAGQADSITELKAAYGDRLAILGIAGLGDNAAMHEFVSDLDVDTVPNLDDRAGDVWRRFGITEQSTFVLIDRRGTVVETRWLDTIDLTAKVKTLVG